jgi:Skp family chaperone for outer membrane proteins
MNRIIRLAGILCTLCVLVTASALAQTRVGYVASLVIRERFPEAQQVNQRIETVVGEWKKNLEERQTAIDNLQVDIQKNRLIWG